MGDAALAKTMRRLRVKAPVEKIVETNWVATALNHGTGKLNLHDRIVILACGHYAVARGLAKSAACHQCHEMILKGEDYDAFRNEDRPHE